MTKAGRRWFEWRLIPVKMADIQIVSGRATQNTVCAEKRLCDQPGHPIAICADGALLSQLWA